jgi:DNA-binding response OmpR family regulator
VSEVKPDVLILDINLPGMHGWDILKQLIAQNMQFRGVIMLTAQTSATHRVIAHLQDAVTHFLGKPFDPQDLREAVEQALDIQ